MSQKADTRVVFFEGNRFTLRLDKIASWSMYTITGIDHKISMVRLPAEVDKIPVRTLSLRKDQVLPGIRTLVIGPHLSHISLSNRAFPDLERILVRKGNETFSSDGKMLYSQNGKILLYSFASNPYATVTLSENVEVVEKTAFAGAEFSEIVCQNPSVKIMAGAFLGSSWERDHTILTQGDTLVSLIKPQEVLELGPEIKRISCRAFSSYQPSVLRLHFFPDPDSLRDREERSSRKKKQGSGVSLVDVVAKIRRIEILDPKAEIPDELLMHWLDLEAVTFPNGHETFVSQGPFVMKRTKENLSLVMTYGQDQEEIHVPKGVTRIKKDAFLACVRGNRLTLPASVRTVDKEAITWAEEIWAYEGTARGLLTSLLDPMFFGKRTVMIHMRKRGEDGKEEGEDILIPEEVLEEEEALSQMWDGPVFNYVAYQMAFEVAWEEEEKVQVALTILSHLEPERTEGLLEYIQEHRPATARYLASLSQAELSEKLGLPFMDEALLEEILTECNRTGQALKAAQVLEAGKGRRKDSSFPL